VGARAPIDPVFVAAALRLAQRGLTDAEIVRALQPLTGTVRKAAPSYSSVRRITVDARRPAPPPNPFVEEIVTKLMTGRMPDLYRASLLHALQAGSGPGDTAASLRGRRRARSGAP
jgi:hypothetical protein